MSKIISETQFAFLGSHQLVDDVLALNEVVDEVKKSKQLAFVFKANFEKAYDCVDWSFLDWMMEQFGFGARWRGWIKECLSTEKVSMLVNGSPIEEFGVGKGLRQGDPLSPFLFLMIGEGLHRGKSESQKMWDPMVNRFRAKLAIWISKLWKDIISLGGKSSILRDKLVQGFRWEVGSGSNVALWWESWVGVKALRDSCPKFFALAVNKDGLVSEMGLWEGDRWWWNIDWRSGRLGQEKD
ncbi:hypothetical protein SLEP1_g9611 [Rubroshorea leprosula]|uniref:Reverse transcriptase domain-containing protein n=1 Tax=Rubroshorea leprosula TaxID=152421 RepID=A0AAV5IGG0_9ROSI|nr:hypothetical protein SLEP1_g9611 [Rubroshorea leprosula]